MPMVDMLEYYNKKSEMRPTPLHSTSSGNYALVAKAWPADMMLQNQITSNNGSRTKL